MNESVDANGIQLLYCAFSEKTVIISGGSWLLKYKLWYTHEQIIRIFFYNSSIYQNNMWGDIFLPA